MKARPAASDFFLPLAAVFLILTNAAPIAAANPASPCEAREGQRARLSRPECEIIAAQSAHQHAVVYRDNILTVLAIKSDLVRRGNVVEASLVLDFATPSSDRAKSEPKSQLRRQRFDCADGRHAIESSADYARPVARGEAIASSQSPNAAMQLLRPGSVDARVAAVLCQQVKA